MGMLCKMNMWLVMQVQEPPWPQPSFDRLQTKLPLAAEALIPRKCSSVCSTRDWGPVRMEGQRAAHQPFSISRDKCQLLQLSKQPVLGRRPWSQGSGPWRICRQQRWPAAPTGALALLWCWPKPPAGTSQSLGCFLPFTSPSCLLRPGPNSSSGVSATSHQPRLDSAKLSDSFIWKDALVSAFLLLAQL